MRFRFRRKKLKSIALLPTLLTLGNGVCGFASVVATANALDTKEVAGFATAAWFLFLSMVFDALDGKVARLTKMATNFGGQLDSLCDAVSFGLAPAFLGLTLVKVAQAPFPARFLWIICGLYMVCAILRLARFNVENSPDDTSHESFRGLPSPAAAGVVAAGALLHAELAAAGVSTRAIVACLPFMILAVALLMVSQVRYVHLVNRLFSGHSSFARLVEMLAGVLVIGALMVLAPEATLLGGFTLYALSGPVLVLRARLLHRPAPQPLPHPQEPNP